MDVLRKADLLTLLQKPDGPAVSIYMPTHRVADMEGDPLLLRHLLDDAETKLTQMGLKTAEARNLLSPARELLRDALFWQHQEEGLALFISRNSFSHFNLPFEVAETAVASGEYFIKPLLPLVINDGVYYLLALSLNRAAFFRCLMGNCQEIIPVKMPHSLEESMRYDEAEKQLQQHTLGAGATMFHGQGAPNDLEKERAAIFFQQVNRSLETVLAGEKAPLVVAGVENHRALFRTVCSYDNLLSEGIEGNPDRVNPDTLQKNAWKLVRPYFMQEQSKRLSQYINATGQGPSISDLAQVIPAAVDGRVYSLFFAEGLERWGAFDEAEHCVKVVKEPSNGAYDLIEFLIKKTLATGGNVYSLKSDELPSDTGVAAVLRY
ncbi:hypothetical protein [Dehalogenimonas etheniformans]|uniref:Uncharacterized protein n=1 Tax=Dehalogenimonas etheniformans TaxID=1536648 RepID=A0A2P5P5M3_9CHLR|nr:hypothetical protein [Dehalogenimonas etheniformans]PPD57598.1 hypothetical protein JP09_007575 [Dehalogenimonas etheniformans]QNT75938.1 hypothetical protein HX448_04160 [Dehalogenimonas etheniformans]